MGAVIAYVVSGTAAASAVTPVNTVTHTAGSPIAIGGGAQNRWECQIFCVRGFRDGRNVMCSCISRSPPSNAWWPTKAGQQALSRPLAAEGGGRRPAFTGLADRPYSYHRV